MTNAQPDNPPPPPPERPTPPPPEAPRRARWERLSLAIQLVLSLGVAGAALAYLSWPKAESAEDDVRPTLPEPVVRLVGPRSIRVRPGTPLDDKLQIGSVQSRWLSAPVLPVTGTALASLKPGDDETRDNWQFATPELLTTFSDWRKAVADIRFQETQLKAIRDLNDERVKAQTRLVARMKKLLTAGTVAEKEAVAEEVNLRQFEIQRRKEVHEAETAVKLARRAEATLSRQLQQAGLEPTMLRSAAEQGEIVVAEVPERVMARVRLGMKCDVRFFAMPNREFSGKVSAISPVISKDKRILNVQFGVVRDPDGRIRPGMFAEIGLGTDRRQALLMPADGLLHVGERDYALVGVAPGTWHITEVETGELRGVEVEVLRGLSAGERVLGKGAILLKPTVSLALQAPVGASSNGAKRARLAHGGEE